MYRVLAWKRAFRDKAMADCESEKTQVGPSSNVRKSFIVACADTASFSALVNAPYSLSVEDKQIVGINLQAHDTVMPFTVNTKAATLRR